MTSAVLVDWSSANQRLLVSELTRVKAQLAQEDNVESLRAAAAEAREAMPEISALDQLVRSFQLSGFERDLLLLCAGVEMDATIARSCASLNGESRLAWATFGLALRSFEDAHWSALTPVRPLRRWRLVELDESGGLTQGRLRIDERVLHYLTGVNYLDPRLNSLLRIHEPPKIMAQDHRELATAIRKALTEASAVPAAMLVGDDPSGHADIAAAAAAELSCTLHLIRAEDIPQNHAEVEALVVLYGREAELLESALLVQCGDDTPPKQTSKFIERLGCPTFVSGREAVRTERALLMFRANKPGARQQQYLWQQALGDQEMNAEVDAVAGQFRLSAKDIYTQGSLLRATVNHGATTGSVLWQNCRALGQPKLDELAQRIAPSAGWRDLILGEEQIHTLRQMVNHVKQRLKVYDEWGFAAKGSRGLGISALFAGESGTGKTMAAEVIANEIRLDLYRVDLSSVVSKYIGETEKNLRRVFDAAEDSGAILLFDEADALFGKRSEVKDSHDRYANIEVSYLLQRMEVYRGLAILTTNIKSALDTAFQRRLRFVIQFPFPDQQQREAIWRAVFPPSTPLRELDYAKLARLQVAGGAIRNIAVNASFLAAGEEAPVSMQHLQEAAHYEAAKRERPLSDSETRGWV